MDGMTRRDVREEVGARIRAIRQRSGMGVRTLSILSDVPEIMLARIERGRMRITFENLVCIARALRVRVTIFLDSDDTDGEFGPGA